MTHSSTRSIWWQQAAPVSFPALKGEVEVDVVIVGGGIAGMAAAYAIKKAGMTVAVVEKNTIASGTTAGTTGKVTAQHGLIYADLEKRFGQQATRIYARVFIDVLEAMESTIRSLKIDCDWERADNYVYTTQKDTIKQMKEEVSAAARAGLPASFVTDIELPFHVRGAVKFSDQAKFNAVKFTRSLAKHVAGNGSVVFENSEVNTFEDGDTCKISTESGTIFAKYIVIASKIPPWPLTARASYAGIVYPETSYLVSCKVDKQLSGMYISTDSDHYSLLSANGQLLIGGENHIPGLGRPDVRYAKLEAYGKKYFDADEPEHRWKAMDYCAYDKLPVVGKLYPWSKNMYVITGFKKWGLSTSWVTAAIVRDLILGENTLEAQLFRPWRSSAPLSAPRALFSLIK